jgi:hypothetical protein
VKEMFAGFLSQFNNELKGSGQISSSLADVIANSSKSLISDFQSIGSNITSYYNSLGINISIGGFEKYLDFDGDGLVGANDMDNFDNVVFNSITVTGSLDSIYYSNEVRLTNITGNTFLITKTPSNTYSFGYLSINELQQNYLANPIFIILKRMIRLR